MPKARSGKPVIIITTGDPAGIGPEVTDKALDYKPLKGKAEFVVLGTERAAKVKVPIGVPSREGGSISAENIRRAVSMLRAISGPKALVTAPISKFSLKKAGINFPGHTEMLASLTASRHVTMMFSADKFRVALVTRHIPLSRVSSEIDQKKIILTTGAFYSALRYRFGIRRPAIGVSALNPHAGESGLMGREENGIILPAVKNLRKKFGSIIGPVPADSLFRLLYLGRLDGVVSMYHDQGLVPFKMLYFNKGVNVTLGLPFIRTSPDHGTAFDIAGKGKADPSSMIEAISLAIKLS